MGVNLPETYPGRGLPASDHLMFQTRIRHWQAIDIISALIVITNLVQTLRTLCTFKSYVKYIIEYFFLTLIVMLTINAYSITHLQQYYVTVSVISKANDPVTNHKILPFSKNSCRIVTDVGHNAN